MEVSAKRIAVRGDDGRTIELDPRAYQDLDHGYAVTVHKSQGVTVDRAYVHAGRGFDRHLAYVACSRHREELTMVHSQEAFPGDGDLARVLGRERTKDTTLDYNEREDLKALRAMLPPPRPIEPPRSPDDPQRDRGLSRSR